MLNIKVFKKYVKESIKDYEALGQKRLVKELSQVLKDDKLTMHNVTPWVEIIIMTRKNMENFIVSNSNEVSEYNFYSAQIKKEHDYIMKFIENYFDIDYMGNFVSIARKKRVKDEHE